MRIFLKKPTGRNNGDVWIKKRNGNVDLISERKAPLYPQWNEISFPSAKSERSTNKLIESELARKDDSNSTLRQNRKYVQQHWKLLRKLNDRFRKKVCKQQQLKADLFRLQKQILEVKQEIININNK